MGPMSQTQPGASSQNPTRNSVRLVLCTVHGPKRRSWLGPSKAGNRDGTQAAANARPDPGS